MAGQDARKSPEMSAAHRRKSLSANQEKALAALLVLPTITAAARRCSLNERTIRRYLKDPQFAARYAEEREALVDEAISAVEKLALGAAKAINDALGHEDVITRLRASRQAWDLLMRDREFRAKVAGQISDGAEVHISLHEHPEWQQLQALIFRALDDFPEATMAILKAINGGTPNGHG